MSEDQYKGLYLIIFLSFLIACRKDSNDISYPNQYKSDTFQEKNIKEQVISSGKKDINKLSEVVQNSNCGYGDNYVAKNNKKNSCILKPLEREPEKNLNKKQNNIHCNENYKEEINESNFSLKNETIGSQCDVKNSLQNFNNSEISVLLVNGLQSNIEDMNFWKSALNSAAKHFSAVHLNFTKNSSIINLSQQIKDKLLKSIYMKGIKLVIFVCHGVGGNICIQGLGDLLRNDTKLQNYIDSKKINIRVICVGTPLKGALLLKKLPNKLLESLGYTQNINIIKELQNTDLITKCTINNLNLLHERLQEKIKIIPIVTTSDFLSDIVPLLSGIQNNYKSMFNEIMNSVSLDMLNNQTYSTNDISDLLCSSLSKNKNLLNFDSVKEIATIQSEVGLNDGIVTLDSQEGHNVIPKSMLFNKTTYRVKKLSHINFYAKIQEPFKSIIYEFEEKNTENSQLQSKKIVQIFIDLIKASIS